MNIINVTCSSCGATVEVNADLPQCNCNVCGNPLFMRSTGSFQNPAQAMKEYKRRRNWFRFLFVIAELCSLGLTLGFCRLFAWGLDTNVFKENTWCIYAVWLIIAYQIYKFFKYKMR